MYRQDVKINRMHELLEVIARQVQANTADLNNVKADLHNVRSDLNNVKSDLNNLKATVANLPDKAYLDKKFAEFWVEWHSA